MLYNDLELLKKRLRFSKPLYNLYLISNILLILIDSKEDNKDNKPLLVTLTPYRRLV